MIKKLLVRHELFKLLAIFMYTIYRSYVQSRGVDNPRGKVVSSELVRLFIKSLTANIS